MIGLVSQVKASRAVFIVTVAPCQSGCGNPPEKFGTDSGAVSDPASRQKYFSGHSQALARILLLTGHCCWCMQNCNDSHGALSMETQISRVI